VKVDGESFIDHILKHIVGKDILRLYPGEEHKVIIHPGSAGSHVCSETSAWMKSRGVKFFPGARIDQQHSGFVFSEFGNKLDR
jgi:hypothetical protein